MTAHPLSSEAFFPDLPSAAWKQINEVIERFENAWRTGGCPTVEDYLDFTGEQRRALLVELVHVDVQQRAARGAPAWLEVHLALHPELQEDSGVLVDLLRAEYAVRRTREPDLGPEEYLRRFPQHAAALAACFQPPAGPIDPTGPTMAPGTLAFSGVGPHGSSEVTCDPHEARTLAPGQGTAAPPSVPGYEILAELGRGGMGVVYQARHLALDRVVALKISLAGDHAGPGDRERLQAEARAVAHLQHPNIVQIHEVGEHNGLPFFSLEFCPGGSLEKKLGGSPVPPAEAAVVIETLARAMQVAHEARVIHRDLKPANVLLGADGTLKITDFGLAKRLDEAGKTHHGAIQGTPSYMAPEQAIGAIDEIGPVSDVYSLTAILYQLLTGRPPFRGASAWDTLAMVCQQEPVPPGRLQAKIPFDLETICLKGLHKQPSRRYASAHDLACDLRRFLNEEPIHARRTPLWEQAWKWAHRRPAAAALVLLSAAAAVGLLGLSVGFNAHLQRAVDQARHDEQQARREADAVKQSQQLAATQSAGQELLARAEAAFASGDQAKTREHLVAAALQLHDDPSLAALRDRAASLRTALDNLERFRKLRFDAVFYANLATGQDAARHADKAREFAQEALRLFGVSGDLQQGPPLCRGPFHADQIAEINAGCYELLLAWADALALPLPGQQPEQRRERLRQACRMLDRVERLGQPSPQACHLQRARYLAELGDAAAAKREQDRAAARPPDAPFDFLLAGTEYARRNDLPRAVRAFETALQRQPALFWAHYFAAVCYLKQNRLAEAVGSLTACIVQRPDFPWAYSLRGSAHSQMGDFAAAEADFRKARELRPDQEAGYAILVNRGAMRYREGKLPAAVKDFQEAVGLRPTGWQGHLNLARAFQKQQKWELALAAFARAIACDPAEPTPYRGRAGLFQERRNWPAALKDLDRALDLVKAASVRAAGQAVPLATLFAERGHVLALSGRHADALADYQAALILLPAYPDVQLHRWRGESLLAVQRDADAVAAFDRYLAGTGKPAAAVYRGRGLAQARLGKHLSAIEDYTLALRLAADAATHVHRGWEYALVANAPRLALADFEAAIQLDPEAGEAYYGRGYARVKLHQSKEGLADVQTALAKGPRPSRLLCLAARAYAQAGAGVSLDPSAPDRRALNLRATYLDRSVELLDQALAAKPAAERGDLWQTLRADSELSPLARLPAFLRLAARYSGLAKTANAKK